MEVQTEYLEATLGPEGHHSSLLDTTSFCKHLHLTFRGKYTRYKNILIAIPNWDHTQYI